jgi:hypothetical protein
MPGDAISELRDRPGRHTNYAKVEHDVRGYPNQSTIVSMTPMSTCRALAIFDNVQHGLTSLLPIQHTIVHGVVLRLGLTFIFGLTLGMPAEDRQLPRSCEVSPLRHHHVHLVPALSRQLSASPGCYQSLPGEKQRIDLCHRIRGLARLGDVREIVVWSGDRGGQMLLGQLSAVRLNRIS